MNVVFRVDASNKIGIGHVMRCQSLGLELRKKGVNVLFICRRDEGDCSSLLINNGFSIAFLTSNIEENEDADKTIKILKDFEPDWVILDHYALGILWEEKIKNLNTKLLVIDDLEDRPHKADFLLNQNFGYNKVELYKNLVSKPCKLILGPNYSLINNVYRKYNQLKINKYNKIPRVLISFGGADLDNLTCYIVKNLLIIFENKLILDVVIGINYQHRELLKKLYKNVNNINIHYNLPTIAPILINADIAFGGGGSTNWERMCIGVPSIVISQAKNQLPACKALAEHGLINYLGDYKNLDKNKLKHSVLNFLQDKNNLFRMSEMCKIQVDGLGSERLVELMFPRNLSEGFFREANFEDCFICFNLKNTKNKNYKKYTEFKKNFFKKIKKKSNYIFIFYMNDLPLAFFEMEMIDDNTYISGYFERLIIDYSSKKTIYANVMNYFVTREKIKGNNKKNFFIINKKVSNHKDKKSYKIVILSDKNSWINKFLNELVFSWLKNGHKVLWLNNLQDIPKADFCFYLGFSRIVSKDHLNKFKNNLVVHESDLPQGKGWSPLTWQVIEGKSKIVSSIFEADEKVDNGNIYLQDYIKLSNVDLINELRKKQAKITIKLCQKFIDFYPNVLNQSRVQNGKESFYIRRQQKDSSLDINKSIRSQFNLLRTVDNALYPAFFEYKGKKFIIKIEKED